MRQTNQCLFLRIKILLIAHFNKLIWKAFWLSSYFFSFFKLHTENAKIGILEDLGIKISFAAQPW